MKMEREFREKVIQALTEQGWAIEKQPMDSPVDLIATRGSDKRAFRVTVKGHLYNKEVTTLREYGMDNEIDVLHVCRGGLEKLRFIRMYPRNIHKYQLKE